MEWNDEYQQAITGAADLWYQNAIHQPFRQQYLHYASYNAGIRLAAGYTKGPEWTIVCPIPRNFSRGQVRTFIASKAGRLPILDPER